MKSSQPQPPEVKSVADARAEIARAGLRVGQFSQVIGVHPSYLGQVLRGKEPLSRWMLLRISAGLAEVARTPTDEQPKPLAPMPRIRRIR